MGTTDVRTILAQRIREERMKKNWTRAQLAEQLNVNSPSSIGNWESGLAAPDCDKINMMADLFEVSVDYLFGREDYDAVKAEIKTGKQKEENALLTKIDACDEIGQESIRNCIDFHYDRCVGSRLKDRPERRKNTTGIQRLFLDKDKDEDYEEMAEKLPYLKSLKKTKKKSLMSITEYLWDLGYGSEICLAYVMDILGYGLNKRVPCQRLYRDIENYLKGNYKIFSE